MSEPAAPVGSDATGPASAAAVAQAPAQRPAPQAQAPHGGEVAGDAETPAATCEQASADPKAPDDAQAAGTAAAELREQGVDPEVIGDVLFVSTDKDGKLVQAHDTQGPSHRAREWRGARGYAGPGGPIEQVRQVQRFWSLEHPGQLLKWSFPTRRRDCLRISFRTIDKMESLTTSDFRGAFEELAVGCPPQVVRSISYLYLNYLQPHHKRIQAQGRHLLMLKVYESKHEVHCWHIPLKEVRELHKQAAEAMVGGVSLNDVQLVETYAVENTFVLHTETFAGGFGNDRDASQRGNPYGKCTWVGGMALHLITEESELPARDRSQEFAMVPDEELAELTQKRVKMREKRARRKATQKLKKEEEAEAKAVEDQMVRELEESAAAVRRKEGLVQPHESLSRLFKSGPVDE